MTVITGVSGSGKSSLAFDTIFAEGQRRFAGSFSTYARRFVQQDGDARFDGVSGLTPTVAIRQQAPSRNPRSTVATLTEIHDGYRLLYSRLGTRMCPQLRRRAGRRRGAPRAGSKARHTLTAAMFSPNSEQGACPQCRGLGHTLECDPAKLVTDPSKPLAGGAMDGHKAGRFYGDPHGQHMATLAAAGSALGVDVSAPWDALERPRARDSPCAARATGCSTSSGGTAAARARARTASRRRGLACSSWSASSTSASTPTGAARPSSPSWSPSRAAPAAAAA